MTITNATEAEHREILNKIGYTGMKKTELIGLLIGILERAQDTEHKIELAKEISELLPSHWNAPGMSNAEWKRLARERFGVGQQDFIELRKIAVKEQFARRKPSYGNCVGSFMRGFKMPSLPEPERPTFATPNNRPQF